MKQIIVLFILVLLAIFIGGKILGTAGDTTGTLAGAAESIVTDTVTEVAALN